MPLKTLRAALIQALRPETALFQNRVEVGRILRVLRKQKQYIAHLGRRRRTPSAFVVGEFANL